MTGRYTKTPLIYMAAHINMTSLPELNVDQRANTAQEMVNCGLPETVTGEFQPAQLSLSSEANHEPASTSNVIPRYGFFSQNRDNALILSPTGIEWRTATYSRYDNVCQQIEAAIVALCSTVDICQVIPVRELSLSYVGIIAPTEKRALADYFAAGDSLLPLNMFRGAENDVQNFGYIQADRIVEPDKRIFISLEQLPVIEGKPGRTLPQSMIEPDAKFGIRPCLRADQTIIASDHYALLATQAALLTEITLQDLRFREACRPIHSLIRSTFEELINRSVCDEAWEYIADSIEGGKGEN